MLNIAQCTCTHLLRSKAHINWSKNLLISWKSYRYHQYPKYIPSYREPLLTYTDNFTELGANLRYFMMLIVRLLVIPTQDLLALKLKLFKVFKLTCANEWLESNHWYQWFLVWQTIGSDGFSMVFPLETMVFQWFFAVEPLVSMVFLPLNHWYQWFVQWLLTVEKTSDGHQWFTE